MKDSKLDLINFYHDHGAYYWSDSKGVSDDLLISAKDTLKYLARLMATNELLFWVDCVPTDHIERAKRFLIDYKFNAVAEIPLEREYGWGWIPKLSLVELLDLLARYPLLLNHCLSTSTRDCNPSLLNQEQLDYVVKVGIPSNVPRYDSLELIKATFNTGKYASIKIAGMRYYGNSLETAKPYLTNQEIKEISREIIKCRL